MKNIQKKNHRLIFNKCMQNDLDILKKEIDTFKKENERLKVENELFNIRAIEKENQFELVIKESLFLKEKTSRSTITEQKLITQIETWQKAVEEMAHSIETDVYVAVANLDKHKDLPRIKKASYHVKQIRDLTNLLMWYINRDRLTISGELDTVNINKIIYTQIETIKDGISTLRISSDEHQENILKMEIPIETEGDTSVLITKEITDAVGLVLKDLLRNAIKNTNEKQPEVKIKIIGNENSVVVEIQNNLAISKEISTWLNNETTVEPEKMSKSARVGLRVIKMWIELLKIDAKLLPDYQNNLTTARIIFPKEIRYEKN